MNVFSYIRNLPLFLIVRTEDAASWVMLGNESYSRRLSKCMRLTSHWNAGVRQAAVTEIISSEHDRARAKRIIKLLARKIMSDPNLSVRQAAYVSLVLQLKWIFESQSEQALNPIAIKALTRWIGHQPPGIDPDLMQLEDMPHSLLEALPKTKGIEEFVKAVEACAVNTQRDEECRDSAKRILHALSLYGCHTSY